MNKYIIILVFFCFAGFSFTACQEDSIDTFSGDDNIYYTWAMNGSPYSFGEKVDSTAVSFAYTLSDVTDSIFRIPIGIQGKISEQDRKVSVRIMEESTAIAGTHFSIPTDIVIPAKSLFGTIPVTLFRAADMKTDVFSIKLQLQANENFSTEIWGDIDTGNNSDRKLSYKDFELTVSDIFTVPAAWNKLQLWLGPFSVKKLLLLAEVNEMPIPNFEVFPSYGDMIVWKDVLKAYLMDMDDAGTPVLEEDGSKMVLGIYA